VSLTGETDIVMLGRRFKRMEKAAIVYVGDDELIMNKFIMPNIGLDMPIVHLPPSTCSATPVEPR